MDLQQDTCITSESRAPAYRRPSFNALAGCDMKTKPFILLMLVAIIITSVVVVYYRSPYQRGRSVAKADLAIGNPRYFLIGEPIAYPNSPIDVKLQRYNMTLVQLGCCVSDPDAKYVKGYNEVINNTLGNKYGHDFIQKAFEIDEEPNHVPVIMNGR